jgi:hypothetical protein
MAQPSDLIGQMLSAGAQNDPMRGFITAAQAADALITSRQNRKAQLEELELQHGQLVLQQLNSDRGYEIDKANLGIALDKSNREAELMSFTKRTMAAQALHQEISAEVMKNQTIAANEQIHRDDMLRNKLLVRSGREPLPTRGYFNPLSMAAMGTPGYAAEWIPGTDGGVPPTPKTAVAILNHGEDTYKDVADKAEADALDAQASAIESSYKPLQEEIASKRTIVTLNRESAKTARQKLIDEKNRLNSMTERASSLESEAAKIAKYAEYDPIRGGGLSPDSPDVIQMNSLRNQAASLRKSLRESAPIPDTSAEADKLDQEATDIETDISYLSNSINNGDIEKAQALREQATNLRTASDNRVAESKKSMYDALYSDFETDARHAELNNKSAAMYLPEMASTLPLASDLEYFERGGNEAQKAAKEMGPQYVIDKNEKAIETYFPGFFNTAIGKVVRNAVPSDRYLMPDETKIAEWIDKNSKLRGPEVMGAQMQEKIEATTQVYERFDGMPLQIKPQELGKEYIIGEDLRKGKPVYWPIKTRAALGTMEYFNKTNSMLSVISNIRKTLDENPNMRKDATVYDKVARDIADALGIPIDSKAAKVDAWGYLVTTDALKMNSGSAATDQEFARTLKSVGEAMSRGQGYEALKLFENKIRSDVKQQYNTAAGVGSFIPPESVSQTADAIRVANNQSTDKYGFKPIRVTGSDDFIPKDPANASLIQSYVDNAKGETDRTKALEWLNKAKALSIVTKRATP